MPKCLECNNTTDFISYYRDVTVSKYEGGDEIDSWSASYEPTGEPSECSPCGSKDIEW
jgi:hypothetical protein